MSSHAPADGTRIASRREARHRSTRLPGPMQAVLCAISVLALTLATAPVSVFAAGATYYVNCSAGRDSHSGRSPSLAWRTMAKANAAPLQPGDNLLFKRGCRWTGPLNARWNGLPGAPIVIGAYGKGALPKIENARVNMLVTGSYLVFTHLMTRADPAGFAQSCGNEPFGWIVGWRFMSGSSHNVVRNSKARGLYMGVFIDSGSHDNSILNNTFIDNNVVAGVDAASGGSGVVVYGDNNEIAHNLVSGSDSCSLRYGRDGSAVEIFGGRNNNIHHNRAVNNNTFIELGNARTANNRIAYNVITSDLRIANFLVARGAQDVTWGPTLNTRVYNNSVYLSGEQSFGVVCGGNCDASILTFKNNIVWSRYSVGWVDSTWAESNNIWWSPGGPRIWFAMSPSSIAADPKFADAERGRLRIGSTSPAVDAGTVESLQQGYAIDFRGLAVPQGGVVDIGAFEVP